VPSLRWVLGIELIDSYALIWVGAAVLVSWGAAEIYSRVITEPKTLSNKRGVVDLVGNFDEVLRKR